MDRRSLVYIAMVVVFLLGSLAAVSCGTGQGATAVPSQQQQVTPPALDGQALVQERCTKCHDLGRITQAQKTQAEWQATVQRMVGKGASLSAAEQEAVIQYLAEKYPKP